MDRPRKTHLLPTNHDPVRRLVAAYTLYAVSDYFFPPKSLPKKYQRSAKEFIESADGQHLITRFGVSTSRIEEVIGQWSEYAINPSSPGRINGVTLGKNKNEPG